MILLKPKSHHWSAKLIISQISKRFCNPKLILVNPETVIRHTHDIPFIRKCSPVHPFTVIFHLCIPSAGNVDLCIPSAESVYVSIPSAGSNHLHIPSAGSVHLCISSAGSVQLSIPWQGQYSCLSLLQEVLTCVPFSRKWPTVYPFARCIHFKYLFSRKWSPVPPPNKLPNSCSWGQ